MKFVRRIWPAAVLVVLLAAGAGLWLKHDAVLDWLATRGYQPSAQMSHIVSETTMTPYAQRLLFANQPAIETKQAFNQHCTDPSDQVAVLGCFVGNRLGIYIYDVTEPRLQGIEEVTAAHEMLHQAYQRLGKQEKTRINGLLQEYHDLKASQALRDKIASYKASEPDQLLNEMHSIFGTEAPDLPVELETYYKQYFTDRQQVLALHQKYQSEFDQRIAQIHEYDTRLAGLKSQIDADKQSLKIYEQNLRDQRHQLDAYLANNQINQYNAAVPGYNATVAQYRNLVAATNRLIDEFNQVLADRNTLAVQERQLEDAIDSSVNAAQKQ